MISTSPYENQEEFAPIFVRLPGINHENALIAFLHGGKSAKSTLSVLNELNAFEDLLDESLTAMAFGILYDRVRSILRNAPCGFVEDFCGVIELGVDREQLTHEEGAAILELFGPSGPRCAK